MTPGWQAGDHALCITDDWNVDHILLHDPSQLVYKGRTYVVRDINPDGYLCLVGIQVNIGSGGYEGGWDPQGFQKVWEQSEAVAVMASQEITV